MGEQISKELIKSLVTEGIVAGGFIMPGHDWEVHHTGERILIRDRPMAQETKGAIVVADRLTESILMTAALSALRNYMLIGMEIDPDVELSQVRAERLRHASNFDSHYWAVYGINDSLLVSLGTASSSGRLVGEIIHAQIGHAFKQRKVCAGCGMLNVYLERNCVRCGAQLMAMVDQNRWKNYDNEETVVRSLTMEEKRELAAAQEASQAYQSDAISEIEATLEHTSTDNTITAETNGQYIADDDTPVVERTIRHKLSKEEQEMLQAAYNNKVSPPQKPPPSSKWQRQIGTSS